MFNYKKTKKPNSRYDSEEYMPRIIEKMFQMGGTFSYDQENLKMNYSMKINRLKTSTKELNNQLKLYREDLDNFFIENNSLQSQLKNNYKNLKNELNNNIQVVKTKIDEQSSNQKKFETKLKEDFVELENSNTNIKKLINDVSERIDKLNIKLSGKKYN